jgi:hypothetical protein
LQHLALGHERQARGLHVRIQMPQA